MALDDRDYTNEEHYPSCTCIACCRKRAQRAAERWCTRHNRPKESSGCHLCLLESKGVGVADSGKRKVNWYAIRGETEVGESTRSAIGGVHSGNRLGRAVRGILGKRASP